MPPAAPAGDRLYVKNLAVTVLDGAKIRTAAKAAIDKPRNAENQKHYQEFLKVLDE